MSENKTVRNFKRPAKFLRYSKTINRRRNKPDVMRKGFEMAGIVEAFTKELEPEHPFKDLVAEHQATLISNPPCFL